MHRTRARALRIDLVLPVVLYAAAIALSQPGVSCALSPPPLGPERSAQDTPRAWWERDVLSPPCDYSPRAQAVAQAEVDRIEKTAEESGVPHVFGRGPRTPSEECHEARMDCLAGPMLYFLIAICSHALLFLAGVWSTWLRAALHFSPADSVDAAEFVRVVPIEHAGTAALCPLFEENGRRGFVHQSRKYFYEASAHVFEPLAYPVADSFGEYLGRGRGHASAAAVEAATKLFGINRFEIPIPTFQELFKEHAVAPFFVFQMFCVLLWMLDDYWYYSLFTLAMLLVFESTIVKQRLKNLGIIRAMVPPPHRVYVYRAGKWAQVSSEELVPGDVVSLQRVTAADGSEAPGNVPCDALVLRGACIVNEAMLTGESTPQIKEECAFRPRADRLAIDSQDRRHVVFAGTTVIQATPPAKGGAADAEPAGGETLALAPSPPDAGCIAVVLRTGFETSQGGLMKTILFSSEVATANNVEAMAFIFFLLIFAVAASWYVLEEGLKNVTRSRYRLLLSCTYIITSVVPPELPMELALAVQNSLLALTRLGVYCTEPYRIPFAGRVAMCFFDKTGTLTSENLEVQGVGTAGTEALTPAGSAPRDTLIVMGCCHSLALVNKEVVGDPMEIATVEAAGWTVGANDSLAAKSLDCRARILHRFPFLSALRRSSAVVALNEGADPESLRLVVKGAPEALAPLLASVPAGYRDTYHA